MWSSNDIFIKLKILQKNSLLIIMDLLSLSKKKVVEEVCFQITICLIVSKCILKLLKSIGNKMTFWGQIMCLLGIHLGQVLEIPRRKKQTIMEVTGNRQVHKS